MPSTRRNTLTLVFSAGVLASILAAGTVPTALAAASVVASSPGTFVQGAGFTSAATYTVTETGMDGWADVAKGFHLDISIANPNISYDTASPVSVVAPGSLGAFASFINPQLLRFTALASDLLNQEQFTISGIRVKATCAAPLGPVDTRYQYVASPGNPSIFGSAGGPPFSFPSLGTVTPGCGTTGPLCVAKFNDLNGNGVRDGNPLEPLLIGWLFTVRDNNGNVVATLYSVRQPCADLPPGTYTVTETLQNGWQPTTAGGVTQTVTVVAGQPLNVIFGNHRCCLTFTFLGGKIDNFSVANGATAEPVTPVSITATPAYFDATQANRAFAHRFYLGAGNCIQSATLEIRIKTLHDVPQNDTLGIKVPGSSSWAKLISGIAPTGPWTFPKVKTALFNLGAMPLGGGSTNLIPALNSIRVLDISVQDDTSVDYIKLIVVFCECTHT